jgi:hypothetical protein
MHVHAGVQYTPELVGQVLRPSALLLLLKNDRNDEDGEDENHTTFLY